jgi:methyl-accepting chemotaxis protein
MVKKSISTVLILFASIPIVLAVAVIVVYVSRSSYEMALDLNEQSIEQFTEETQKSFDEYLKSTKNIAATLSLQDAVKQSLYQGNTSRCEERLKRYLQVYKGYYAMLVFDSQGRIVAGMDDAGGSLDGHDISGRPYVKALLSGQRQYVGKELFRAKSGSKPVVFAVSHAIVDDAARFIGGVAVFPKWTLFTREFIDPLRLGERGYGFMLDSKGTFIAHADKKLIGKDSSQESFVREALEQQNGQIYYDWDGEEKFMTFLTDPDTGWVICMSTYTSDLAETALTQRNMLIGIGAVIVLALIGIIMFVVRRLVVTPIMSIEEFTRRVSEGDFSASLDNDFKYELGHLAENIRNMVSELKNKLGFSQGLLDGMTISCIVTDPEEKIIFANQPVLDFLEHEGKPEDYQGMNLSRFFYNVDGQDTIIGRSIRERRSIENVQKEVTTKKGHAVFSQIDAAPMYDLDGKLIAGFALFSDLTELRSQQQQIQKQNDNIGQAARDANQVSDQVASASEELAAQVEQASRGAEEQQQRTSEAATAMEQMNATVMEVAGNASHAAELADRTIAKANEGARVVSEVVNTINDINDKAVQLKSDMTELGGQAEGIGQIMNVISDIADQTNLLALNAAIEAARAGDAGRGFAVVADEVRKLAEKTMNATNEVAESIAAIQASTRKSIGRTEDTSDQIGKSTELVEEAGNSLSEIVTMITQTADQVRSIATASEEQSAASEQINRSTDEINRISAETSDSMVQSSSAVSDLAQLAQELKRIIDQMSASSHSGASA